MKKALLVLLVVVFISGAYLYALPAAIIFYAAVVLLHLVAGGILAATLLVWLLRGFKGLALEARLGWLLLTAGAALGLALVFLGTPRRLEGWLYAHIGLSLVPDAWFWLPRRESAAGSVLGVTLLATRCCWC